MVLRLPVVLRRNRKKGLYPAASKMSPEEIHNLETRNFAAKNKFKKLWLFDRESGKKKLNRLGLRLS
jgi:hypothetical protein